MHPRARRLLERVILAAAWFVVTGDLAAATGLTVFTIELGRLLLTRRDP